MAVEEVEKKVRETGEAGIAAVVYGVALAVLYVSGNKYMPLLLVACGAIAGQFLFVV